MLTQVHCELNDDTNKRCFYTLYVRNNLYSHYLLLEAKLYFFTFPRVSLALTFKFNNTFNNNRYFANIIKIWGGAVPNSGFASLTEAAT